jgi:hypothetical protein
MINEVRVLFLYPSVDFLRPFQREIEPVWGMHSTMIFADIRRYVYHTPVSTDDDTTVLDQVRGYLLMAPGVALSNLWGSVPSTSRQALQPLAFECKSAWTTQVVRQNYGGRPDVSRWTSRAGLSSRSPTKTVCRSNPSSPQVR